MDGKSRKSGFGAACHYILDFPDEFSLRIPRRAYMTKPLAPLAYSRTMAGMTKTARVQQAYDQRLKNLVRSTRKIQVALGVGVPGQKGDRKGGQARFLARELPSYAAEACAGRGKSAQGGRMEGESEGKDQTGP